MWSFYKIYRDEIEKEDNYLEKNFINNNDKIMLLGTWNVIYKNKIYNRS